MTAARRVAPTTRRNETRELTHPIRAALNVLPGVRVWRNTQGYDRRTKTVYGLAVGSADLVGLVDSRFVALEVKWPDEKPDEDQVAWLATVRELGGFACVVHSVDEALAAVARCRAGASE